MLQKFNAKFPHAHFHVDGLGQFSFAARGQIKGSPRKTDSPRCSNHTTPTTDRAESGHFDLDPWTFAA